MTAPALIVPRERIRVGPYVTEHTGFTVPDELRARLAGYSPKTHVGAIVRDCFAHLPAELAGELLDAISRCLVAESALYGIVMRRDGRRERLGLLSQKVVTDAGVAFIVDAFENLLEPETMKYHAVGTGTTAEAASQTALVTELTTQYNPDNTRATGSLTEAAVNILQTVGTNTVDATVALTEHMLMNQAATGGGTGLDRSVFAAINLVSGDSLQTDYRFTLTSGG